MTDLFVEIDNVREAIQMSIDDMDRSPGQLPFVENAIFSLVRWKYSEIGLDRKAADEIDDFKIHVDLLDDDLMMHAKFEWTTASINYGVNLGWYLGPDKTQPKDTANDDYDRAMKGI